MSTGSGSARSQIPPEEEETTISSWLDPAPLLMWFYDEASQMITVWESVSDAILRVHISGAESLQQVDPSDRGLVIDSLQRSLKNNLPLRFEFRYWQEAKPIRLLAVGAPITIESNRRMVVGVAIHSPTSSREETMRETPNVGVIPKFAGILAHELHNPLAAVTNAFYLLRESTGLGDEAQSYLRVASEGLDRVNRITKFLLGVCEEEESRKAAIIADLVDEALAECTRELSGSALRIARRHEFVPVIEVFRQQLERAMCAIVQNAVESCQRDCVLTIHTFCARSSHSKSGRGVWIVMADNGPGVPVNIRERLAQPFVTTKLQPGRGLGLWSAKWIVRKHNGVFLVQSSTAVGHSGTSVGMFIPEQA